MTKTNLTGLSPSIYSDGIKVKKPEKSEYIPMSDAAKALLQAGIESAQRGEIAEWDDFTQFADDEESD